MTAADAHTDLPVARARILLRTQSRPRCPVPERQLSRQLTLETYKPRPRLEKPHLYLWIRVSRLSSGHGGHRVCVSADYPSVPWRVKKDPWPVMCDSQVDV